MVLKPFEFWEFITLISNKISDCSTDPRSGLAQKLALLLCGTSFSND